MKKRESPYHGFLLIDKPLRATSFDLVRAVKRALGTGVVGHAGTLDPLASGLLVVAVGRATKLIRFVQDARKVYEALVVFHEASESGDAEGPLHPIDHPPTIAETALREALQGLEGERDQLPPAFSAKKIDGQRAYDLARSGDSPEMKPCRVTAHSLELLEAVEDAGKGILQARVRCEVGSGYYVRSMARDLGESLGTSARLGGLRRESIGRFQVCDAISADELGWTVEAPSRSDSEPAAMSDAEKSERRACVLKRMISPYEAIAGFPVYQEKTGEAHQLLQGKTIEIGKPEAMEGVDDEGSARDVAISSERLIVVRDLEGPCLLANYRPRGGTLKIAMNLFPLREALKKSSAIPRTSE